MLNSGAKAGSSRDEDEDDGGVAVEDKPRTKPRDKEDLVSPGRAAEILDSRHESIVSAIRRKSLRARRIEGSKGRDSYIITAGALRDYRDALVREYKDRPSKRLRAYAEQIRNVVI